MIMRQCVLKKYLVLFYFLLCVPNYSLATQLDLNASCEQIQMMQSGDIKHCFVGTWKLISNMKKEGDVISYPYGKDALGYITYDSHGYMSVQMMQQNRKTPMPGYFAYFGHYEIDTKANVIHHYLDGSLNPAEEGTDRPRSYQFIGNQLHLIPVEDTNREIIWEKMN